MTKKIYEYKDQDNWYVATWSEYSNLYALGEVADLGQLDALVTRLIGADVSAGPDVAVIQHSFDLVLLTFVADVINQEQGRKIEVTDHAGAVVLTEDGQVLAVHIPKGGVSADSLFGKNLAVADKTILIATRNEGKTREFRNFFEKLGYEVQNLNDYPDLPDVAETGLTFEENARLKAETIAQETGKMVLADDSGLKVDVLGGLPGVWSARFSGPDATDATNNAKLLHELAMVFEQKDRSAQFHCTLVVAAPGRESLVVEADWAGYIGFAPDGENGFGYDPLFLVGETGKTAANLTLEEKNKISHRAKALEKLLEEFPTWQAKKS